MIAGRTLKAAWPNFAGAVIVCSAAFALHVALVFWLFRDAPAALAHFGVLSQLAQVACVVGACGLPIGLFRLYAGPPDDRPNLLVTAWIGAAAVSAAVIAAIQFVPGLASLLVVDDVADGLVAPFLWKTPAVAAVAVAAAAMQATNSLRRRAATEAVEGVAAATFAVVGAFAGGLSGLLWGSFAGSVLVGAMLRPRVMRGRFRRAAFADLFRAGRARAAFLAFDAGLALVVLRVMNAVGPGTQDTGSLVAAMGLVLPFVVLPGTVAQTLYPAMIGARRDEGLDHARRRLFLESAACVVPALAIVTAVAAWLLPRVGNGAFAAASPALLALAPGVAVHALVALSGRVVLVHRQFPRAAAASAATLFVAAVVGTWLVPRWGAVGGATALGAALATRAVLLLVVARTPSNRPTPSDGAPKSLSDVRATADPSSFPKQVLEGRPTTVSFFSAEHYGRNDCIHLADGGIADALLVDIDDAKLGEMRAIYPRTWRYAAGDAYVVAETLRAAQVRFDLVVVDGWTGEAERMLSESLPLWCALSRRFTVLMASRPWFEAQGVEPTPAAVEAWARRRHGLDVKVDELHYRADWVGGVWWIVVRADRAIP